MKKLFLVTSLVVLATNAWAESSSLNLQLPSAPGNYASDKIRAGDLDCSNAIGGGTNLEFGVTGIINNHQGFGGSSISTDDPFYSPQRKDVGVYARITIPLDGPKERINCNTLYQLELQKKRLEVQRLKEELRQLRELNNNGGGFEN